MINYLRYIRDKISRKLRDCNQKISEYESQNAKLGKDIDNVRDRIAVLDKELNESNASMANLRENLRVRNLVKTINQTQAEMDSMDMEQAGKARRHFEERYTVEKQRETEMQSQVGSRVFCYS
jgi:DNA repair protein RAD50